MEEGNGIERNWNIKKKRGEREANRSEMRIEQEEINMGKKEIIMTNVRTRNRRERLQINRREEIENNERKR